MSAACRDLPLPRELKVATLRRDGAVAQVPGDGPEGVDRQGGGIVGHVVDPFVIVGQTPGRSTVAGVINVD